MTEPKVPVDRNRLTIRQMAALDFIRKFIARRGYPPTLREIGEHMDIASTNAVNDHLHALERKGYITRNSIISRGIQLTEKSTDDTVRTLVAGFPTDGLSDLQLQYLAGMRKALRMDETAEEQSA